MGGPPKLSLPRASKMLRPGLPKLVSITWIYGQIHTHMHHLLLLVTTTCSPKRKSKNKSRPPALLLNHWSHSSHKLLFMPRFLLFWKTRTSWGLFVSWSCPDTPKNQWLRSYLFPLPKTWSTSHLWTTNPLYLLLNHCWQEEHCVAPGCPCTALSMVRFYHPHF